MAKIAIPVFRSRIAPVFDSCLRVLVIDIEHDRQIERMDIRLDRLTPAERIGALRRAGVRTLICSGISDVLHTMLESSGVSVIGGIAGQVDEVLTAFMSDRLDEPRFHMPGRGESRMGQLRTALQGFPRVSAKEDTKTGHRNGQSMVQIAKGNRKT